MNQDITRHKKSTGKRSALGKAIGGFVTAPRVTQIHYGNSEGHCQPPHEDAGASPPAPVTDNKEQDANGTPGVMR